MSIQTKLDVTFKFTDIGIKYDAIRVDLSNYRIEVWVNDECMDFPSIRSASNFLKANTMCVMERVAIVINKAAYLRALGSERFSQEFLHEYADIVGSEDGLKAEYAMHTVPMNRRREFKLLCDLFSLDFELQRGPLFRNYIDSGLDIRGEHGKHVKSAKPADCANQGQ